MGPSVEGPIPMSDQSELATYTPAPRWVRMKSSKASR